MTLEYLFITKFEIFAYSVCFLVGSRTETASTFASEIFEYISAFNPGMPTEMVDVNDVSIQKIEELFTEKSKNRLYVLVIASYPDEDFCDNLKAYLEESSVDWRVGKGHLRPSGM